MADQEACEDMLEKVKKFGHDRRVAEMARDLYIASLGQLTKEECKNKAEEYYKE